MTQDDKEVLVNEIFKKKEVFEKEVLNILSDKDRAEIMQILAVSLVRGSLKEELNFLYIKQFSKFTFKPILNILFKEIASEWIYYTMDELGYTKEKALEEIQNKERVLFIRSLVGDYYKKYKHFIFREIADTFIELLKITPHAKTSSKLISEVLNSNLVVRNNIVSVHSFRQIYGRVKRAQNLKNVDTSRIQILINEVSSKISNKDLNEAQKEKLLLLLDRYNKELDKITNKKLDKFDTTLKRFKDTLVSSMLRMDA